MDLPPFSVVFTYDVDEGGYCELFGLRYQIDAGGEPVETMLGRLLDVQVTVRDASGAIGSGEATVRLADTLQR